MYDVKIVGGTIVDGTGRARFRGDVAVADGRIVEVGKCDGAAARVIDADGAVVAPGFVDMHTHYDGQVSWDADLAPSSLHGVTTAVMGSCGVGFAPVRRTAHADLIALMEGVEDIPGSALAEGIKWGWETIPQYMDVVDSFPHAIDFGTQVPHDAVRMFVMGERAVSDQAATPEDIAAMRDVVRDAIEAGAIGFSTGRSENHRTAAGEPTPASEAAGEELAGIAEAFVGLDRGVLQAVSDYDMHRGDEHFHAEFDLLERMVAASGGRPLSVSTMQRDPSPNQWKWIFERAEAAADKGMTIRCQVAPRAIGVMLGLEATFHPFVGFPSYKAIAALPLAERVARMRDPAVRERMLGEKSEPLSGDGSSVPPLADQLLAQIDKVAMRLYRLGEQPNYEPAMNECLYAEAAQSGQSALAVVYDALLEREGTQLLYFPLYNYTGLCLDDVHTMLTHPLALPGLSDGGAHVGTICDASFPTFLMTHWARDRKRAQIPLEQVIKMQAHDTARFLGMTDRGVIAPGLKADLNIIDFERLALRHPALHADLPAGGKRLLQGADGYLATLVSGQVIAENGAFTGARPGRLVRSSAT